MRRAVRFPSSVDLFWTEAQTYYITEQSLSSSRFKSDTTFDFSSLVIPYFSSSCQNNLDSSNFDDNSVISNVTCYSCEEEGHTSPTCPNKLVKSEGKVGPICFKCGGKDHVNMDCPNEQSYPENKEAYKQYLARARSPSQRPFSSRPSSSSHSSSPGIKKSEENINNLGAA